MSFMKLKSMSLSVSLDLVCVCVCCFNLALDLSCGIRMWREETEKSTIDKHKNYMKMVGIG